MDRRHLRETTATLGLGALAGGALPGTAQNAARTPFSVPATHLPIVGSDLVFRVDCIGRYAAAHAREMGSDPAREPPFFFQKPTDASQNMAPATVADQPYPTLTKNDHDAVELVAARHEGGRSIPAASVLDHVYGDAIGLDMTRRDLQRAMGDEKTPWEIGKSFDRSAPIGPLHRVAQTGHFRQGGIGRQVSGDLEQNANLRQMIWNVAEQIAQLSEANALMPGDIIDSGTPENAGAVVRGDVIDSHIDGLPNLDIRIN